MRTSLLSFCLATCCACTALLSTSLAAELEPGIYALTDDADGVKVARADTEGTVSLGPLVADQFGEAVLQSYSNSNDLFHLRLNGAGPFREDAHKRRLAIYAEGVCVVVGGNSEPEQGRMDVSANVAGEANAAKLAAALGAKVRKRSHPGHKWRVSWSPIKLSFAPGEPVMVRLKITNVGEKSFRFFEGGQQRGPRDNQFGFIAFNFLTPVPDTGDPTNFGGIAAFRTVEPGQTFEKEVDLRGWFKFEPGGSYSITGLYQVELLGADDSSTQWEDFAVGTCTVKIAEAAKPAE